jgi:hypothetical protein
MLTKAAGTSQKSTSQHHSREVLREVPLLIQKWITTTNICAVIQMSAIPTKVTLLEIRASPAVIDLLRDGEAALSVVPSSLFST